MNTCPNCGFKHWGDTCYACMSASQPALPRKRVRKVDHSARLLALVALALIVLVVLVLGGVIPLAWLPIIGG